MALVGVLGLAVGSFLNVCIDRLPLGQSLFRPGSHCASCDHPLSPVELVPLLSYLFLRGRCRNCGAPIPWRLPLVELVTGVLFALAAFRFGLSGAGGIAMAYVALLTVLFFVDLERGVVVRTVVYPAVVAGLAVAPFGPSAEGLSLARAYLLALAGGAMGFGVFFLIWGASRGGMGWGDVELGVLIGVLLGLRLTTVAIVLSFVVGGGVALVLLALRIRRRRDAIPFGPFLTGAAVVSLLWGDQVLAWYQGLFPFFG